MIKVTTIGFERVFAKLEMSMDTLLKKGQTSLMIAANEIIVPTVKALAPVGDITTDPLELRPGALKESIHAEEAGWLKVGIGDGVHYGIYKELGHMITERSIRAFRTKMKKFGIPLIPEMAKGPHWVAGMYFLTTGVRASIPQVRELLKKLLEVK